MTTFNNDREEKRLLVEFSISHREKDEFIKGRYNTIENEVFNGCFVGCSIYDLARLKNMSLGETRYDDHKELARLFGTPNDEWLFRYLDRMFERLPSDDSRLLSEQFYAALPVGIDVAPLRHQLAVRRMGRLLKVDHGENVNKAIIGVLVCHEQALVGNDPDWNSAYSAARSAPRSAADFAADSVDFAADFAADSVDSAAYSAAYSAADSVNSAADFAADFAAYSAAYSAADSVNSAAYSAARSAAYSVADFAADFASHSVDSAARSAAWQQERDDLLELIKELK